MSERQTQDFEAFSMGYIDRFVEAIRNLDRRALGEIAIAFAKARREGRQIFIAGNGGSAAIATHAECDVTKGTDVPGMPPMRSRSLASNMSVLTALANDEGYESVFSRQLELYAQEGDVAVFVSSSGNSPNVLRGCETAKAMGLTTIALVGFKGGKLKDAAEIALHVPVENYGIVEDAHQCVFHLVSQYARQIAEKDARQ